MRIPFKNSYYTLGGAFYEKILPDPVLKPGLIKFNEALASELGISSDNFSDVDAAQVFSGNRILEGSQPVAMAYAGHQFGHFNPQLGDGRANLLGDFVDTKGIYVGLQLKGSGRTAYSRGGDGRSALGPVLREYLLSEAMQKLGVPTTRALAAVTTGEEVVRESMVPGGIITRTASSFVRVGTFQYFAARGESENVKALAEYIIHTNYPEVANAENPFAALLQAAVDRQASLIALWMQLGFIHGVMNTDNMSIAGETIDYGPCAFMDAFDHDKVFSSIDRDGRYAYRNQPAIGLWNLTRLAETLLPLMVENAEDNPEAAVEVAQDILQTFQGRYDAEWLSGMQAKCGLYQVAEKMDSDRELIEKLLNIMAENNTDFSLSFFYLSRLNSDPDSDKNENDANFLQLFNKSSKVSDWLKVWRQRISGEVLTDEGRQIKMQSVNPVYIPRNHQVEAAIRAAEDHNDFSAFHDLNEVLQNPYQQQKGKNNYSLPPQVDEIVHKTFCGT